jgi:PPM family protein phosphatase
MVLVGWHRRKHHPVRAPLRDSELRPFIEAGYATDAGPRSTNQDRGAVSTDWAAISDGAGGHAGGEIAAGLAIEHVVSRLGRSGRDIDEALVLEALAGANSAVRARQRTDHRLAAAAATLTIAACTSSQPVTSRWFVANLGDSPVWHSSGENLYRLSEEHNVAAELVRSGLLSPERSRDHPGRHMITKALGMAERTAPHLSHALLRPGDMLVLASDGLEVLTETAVAALCEKPGGAPVVAHGLVVTALAAGATDNVTVAVLKHLPLPVSQNPFAHPGVGKHAKE